MLYILYCSAYMLVVLKNYYIDYSDFKIVKLRLN